MSFTVSFQNFDPNKLQDNTVRVMGPATKGVAATPDTWQGMYRWIHCAGTAGTVVFIDWEGRTWPAIYMPQGGWAYVDVSQIVSSGTTATNLVLAQ